MKYFTLKKNRGFTLVEMMVAIAVFSIVMVTAMSALLNVIDANNKARAIKTAINNISFALEGISKDMRMGTDYSCSSSGDIPNFSGNCPDGGKALRFLSSKLDSSNNRQYAYYKFIETDINGKEVGQILSCIGGSNSSDCTGTYSAVTSSEVDLNNVTFYILNVGEAGKQPRMLMTVNGEAGTKEKIKTTFDLQTGVSQINRPE